MASEPYIGTIFLFAGNFNPRGYQLCQGQLLPISQNAALFSILGTTYGGNGTTTFALPDLRGRAPIGQGNGPGLSPVVLGQQAGTETVSILTSNMPAHNHTLLASTATATAPDPTGNLLAEPIDGGGLNGLAYVPPATAGTPVQMAPLAIGAAGSNIPISIQNPYLGINYIIATVGIFPSRN